MALDPSRAQLVSTQYRYETVEDAAIKAQYPNAREIVLETSLESAAAKTLANSTFRQTGKEARTYEVVVRDRLLSADFMGGAPRYTADFGSRHPAPLAMGLDNDAGLISIDREGTWEFTGEVKIDGATVAGSVFLTAGLHKIAINGAVTYRSPAMIAVGSPPAALPDSLLRHPLNPTYTVIGATTRLRAGTTTLTVRT